MLSRNLPPWLMSLTPVHYPTNVRYIAFTSWYLNVEANFAAKKLIETVTNLYFQFGGENVDPASPALGTPLTIQAPSSS